MERTIVTGAVLLAALPFVALAAEPVLMSEGFETDLSQWVGKGGGAHSGLIVADPIRADNQVVTFAALTGGGDIFSIPEIELFAGAWYRYEVEYLGLAVTGSVPDDFGGYAGLSDVTDDPFHDMGWFWGTNAAYPHIRGHLIDDGQWRQYSYTFEWGPAESTAPGEAEGLDDTVHVMLEDFGASGVPGDVFFDNVLLVVVSAPGDANRDGRVDLQDFGILKDNYAVGGTWAEGDFNGDGFIGLQDFGLLKDNYGTGLGLAGAQAVPEPGALTAAPLGVLFVRRRRGSAR